MPPEKRAQARSEGTRDLRVGSPRPGAAVYETVREMAIEYRFRPDENINEKELAARLGVSRTPVRDALNRLLNEGLVQFERNKGFSCRSLGARDLFFLAEARRTFEVSLVPAIAERADAQAVANLREFVDGVRSNLVLPACELARADEAFHLRFVELARNPVAGEMIRNLCARLRFMRKIMIESHPARDETFAGTSAILAAIERGDGADAARQLDANLKVTPEEAEGAIGIGLSRIFADKVHMDVNLTT